MVQTTQYTVLAQAGLAGKLAEVFRNQEFRNEDSSGGRPAPEFFELANGVLGGRPEVDGGSGNFKLESLSRWFSLDPGTRRKVQDHVFGLIISKETPPYETEFLPWKEAAHLAQSLADISGYYRAFGLEPDPTRPERVDHLALELDFVAHLLGRILYLTETESECTEDKREIVEAALRSFLQSHLAWWVPLFAASVEVRAGRLLQSKPGDIEQPIRIVIDIARLLATLSRMLCADYNVDPAAGLPRGIEGWGTGRAEESMDCMGCASS